jgi:hypothetical protein
VIVLFASFFIMSYVNALVEITLPTLVLLLEVFGKELMPRYKWRKSMLEEIKWGSQLRNCGRLGLRS